MAGLPPVAQVLRGSRGDRGHGHRCSSPRQVPTGRSRYRPGVGDPSRDDRPHPSSSGDAENADSARAVRAGVVEARWGRLLQLVDIRRFGRVAVVRRGDYGSLPTLAALGPEPSPMSSPPRLCTLAVRRSGVRLKTQLLNQRVVAGIGNIYADEALWASRIDPGAVARVRDREPPPCMARCARCSRLASPMAGPRCATTGSSPARPAATNTRCVVMAGLAKSACAVVPIFDAGSSTAGDRSVTVTVVSTADESRSSPMSELFSVAGKTALVTGGVQGSA